MLQKPAMNKSTATVHVTLFRDFGESIFTIHNSVLQKTISSHNLTNLLQDGQDMEEYFLECGSLKVDIQNDNVLAIVKVPEETEAPPASSPQSPAAEIAVTEGIPK